MREAAQRAIMPWGIDDDKAVVLRECIDGVGERRASLALAAGRDVEAQMPGKIELAADALTPRSPVFDVVGQAPLPGIEIDGGHGLLRLDERNSNVHRDRGFA